jgi:SAM-dependent methyltransferase
MNTLPEKPTSEKSYAEGLISRQSAWWKKFFNVQLPYKWNINRLKPGFVLDVGCGIGRNLLHLDGKGIGVDHNPLSVDICRQRGLKAYTVDEFNASEYHIAGKFDSILLAHVAEHMRADEFVALLKEYLPMLKADGRVIVITPQEYGYKTDDTHVQFMDFEAVDRVFSEVGLQTEKQYSFPFPRLAGKLFQYNEFVSVARKSAD